jgi:hypothetical protein
MRVRAFARFCGNDEARRVARISAASSGDRSSKFTGAFAPKALQDDADPGCLFFIPDSTIVGMPLRGFPDIKGPILSNLLQRLAGLTLGVIAPIAWAAPPSQFPVFQEYTEPIVVVATARPGKYLPAFDECVEGCLDPPPFWFEVKVASVVFAKREEKLPGHLYAATTSHFGMSTIGEFGSKPLLILLFSNGKDFVMPRYALSELVRDKKGNLHLPVLWPEATWWLPCSVSDLRQDFPDEILKELIPDQAPDDAGDASLADCKTFTVDYGKPYLIPVARLSAHLNSLAPTRSQMRCQ